MRKTWLLTFPIVSAKLRLLPSFINANERYAGLSAKYLIKNMSSISTKKDEECKDRKEIDHTSARGITTSTVSNESSKDSKAERSDKNEDTSQATTKISTRQNRLSAQKEHVAKDKDHFLSMDIESKRKLYKCKANYTTLDKIETWPQFFNNSLKGDRKMEKWWKNNSKNVKKDINEDLNDKMSLFRGDITSLEIDAIANAANESLLGGGGVDGAIHSAAGSKLRSECELLNGCEPGEAKITCGYKLPAKYVVHTVGPRGERPEVLKSCYVESLNLLKKHKLKSIAFPCISTGIFGYPNGNAADVALSTIRDWLEKEPYAKEVDRIIMCLFLQVDVDVYNELMQLYFPLDRSVAVDTNENHGSEPQGKENVEVEEKENIQDNVEGKENKEKKENQEENMAAKENVEDKESPEGNKNLEDKASGEDKENAQTPPNASSEEDLKKSEEMKKKE